MTDELTPNKDLDPILAEYLREQDKLDLERALPRSERRKLLRERRKNAERRGRRALYDFPPGLIKMGRHR